MVLESNRVVSLKTIKSMINHELRWYRGYISSLVYDFFI